MSLYFPSDRPWLTDVQKVQKLQEKVYVALQRCLQKEGASEEKLAKVRSLLHHRVSLLNKLLCNLSAFSLTCYVLLFSPLDGV